MMCDSHLLSVLLCLKTSIETGWFLPACWLKGTSRWKRNSSEKIENRVDQGHDEIEKGRKENVNESVEDRGDQEEMEGHKESIVFKGLQPFT